MLLTLLRQAIKDRGFTLTAVAKRLSEPRSHSWLSRALDGQRKLAIYQIDEILDILGYPKTYSGAGISKSSVGSGMRTSETSSPLYC